MASGSAHQEISFGLCQGGAGLRHVHRSLVWSLFSGTRLPSSQKRIKDALTKEEWNVAFA